MSSQKTHRKTLAMLLIFLLAGLALVLVACGGKPSIKGKWEQISGPSVIDFFERSGTGTLWEFFDDGTVSISRGEYNIAVEYSWPDDSHLKIGRAVFEFSYSGDEITLKDPSTLKEITLKRYQELSPSPQTLAGTWDKEITMDDSQCFLSLGLDDAPQQISFGADGTFSVKEEAGILSTGISLYGQFSVSNNILHVSATGTKINPGLFGLGASQEQIGGELSCQVTISHSRLLFRDDQGRITLYVRAK